MSTWNPSLQGVRSTRPPSRPQWSPRRGWPCRSGSSDLGGWSSVEASFLDASTGWLAALTAVGAAILAAKRIRMGTVIAFAVVGVLVAVQMMDMDLGNGLSLGIGAYMVLGGLIVGFIVSAIAAARPGIGAPEPAAWVPPVIPDAPNPGVRRPLVDPNDPFRIIG